MTVNGCTEEMHNECQEVPLIGQAYAVPCEGTVVVTLENTLLAQPAMLRPRRGVSFTRAAEPPTWLQDAGQNFTSTGGVYS